MGSQFIRLLPTFLCTAERGKRRNISISVPLCISCVHSFACMSPVRFFITILCFVVATSVATPLYQVILTSYVATYFCFSVATWSNASFCMVLVNKSQRVLLRRK